jgi:hypothetical protein
MFLEDIPDYWSPEQALAIVEFLDDLRNTIYDRYELQIRELQLAERGSVETDPFDQAGWDEDVPF